MITLHATTTWRMAHPVPLTWVPMKEVADQARRLLADRIHGRGIDADGAPLPGNFVHTGRLRDSMRSEVGAQRAAVVYGGSHGRLANSQLAGILFRQAGRNPMQLSSSEVSAIRETVAVGFRRTILGATEAAVGGAQRVGVSVR